MPADATQHDSNAIHPPAVLAWSIWALASALYAVGFFQRTAPAVMTAELMAGFGITAAALGNVASCYFYAYVVMLIPTGLLTAVYGPRKLLTGFCTGGGVLSYAVGREPVPPEPSGAVTGVVITGIMIGPAIIQPVTGVLLDLNWAGDTEAGTRLYGVDAFRTAFLPMLGWTSGAALLVPLVKETFRSERRGGSR